MTLLYERRPWGCFENLSKAWSRCRDAAVWWHNLMSDPFCDINLSNLLFKPSFSNLFSTGHHQHQKYRQNLVISCTFHILLQHPSAELRLNNKTLNEDHTFYYYWGFVSGDNHAAHSEDVEKYVYRPFVLLNLCCRKLIIALIVLSSKRTSKYLNL